MVSAEVSEERRQRKKLQNRLNQRARRLRMKEIAGGALETGNRQRPYRVERWRIDRQDNESRIGIFPSTGAAGTHEARRNLTRNDTVANQFAALVHGHDPMVNYDYILDKVNRLINSRLLLSQEHLLNIIHFNVVRGLFSNKFAIMRLVTHLVHKDGSGLLHDPQFEEPYPCRAITIPNTSGTLPASLQPTRLQSTVLHSTWIDLLPFPRMRDNLIRHESQYNEFDFADDMIGDAVDFRAFINSRGGSSQPRTAVRNMAQGNDCVGGDDHDDEPNSDRNGIIVWGEPYNLENWEITTGFLHKWRWALEGCQDLVECSNRWRMKRGEEPLVVPF
ncbi:hypothetical protein BX600DRAFT_52396 [Xylariales sp. PMI_506]|nr:hypothetical protein BX600DRAFT_52396 [Xylariales sp. PMI_506]